MHTSVGVMWLTVAAATVLALVAQVEVDSNALRSRLAQQVDRFVDERWVAAAEKGEFSGVILVEFKRRLRRT